MAKLYTIDGAEYKGDYFTLADGRPHSGKGFTRHSVRLFTEAELEDRGIEAIKSEPKKRVPKVKTKNTPTTLRNLKDAEDGSE